MDEEALDELIRQAAREARQDLSAHPTPEELLAYHAGRQAEAEVDRLQEHLALCRECTALLLDLEAYPALEPDPEEAAAPDWAAFEARLPPAAPGLVAKPRAAWPLSAYAVAASLLAATLGLSARVFELRRELGRPRVNVHLADLHPIDEATRGEPGRVSVPAASEQVVLILDGMLSGAPGPYRLEVLPAEDARAAPAFRADGLRPGADGQFTLELARERLPAGRYRLRIFAPGAAAPAAEYALDLVYLTR